MKYWIAAAFCASASFAVTSALADDDYSDLPQTPSTHAYAELRDADREDGKLSIEVRFLTDRSGYSGETIYRDLADATSTIYVEAGGKKYSLVNDEDGKPDADERLELQFNYDPDKNPRVGSWEGVFEAPPAEVTEATLILPNVEKIGPFEISNQ